MTDTTSAVPSLLPCPFCGGVPSIKHGKIFNSIVCPPGPCKGTGLVFAFDFGEEETSKAIAAWNRRAPQPVAREPLTDEQIRAMCKQSWVFDTAKQWVRITERAHGITGEKFGDAEQKKKPGNAPWICLLCKSDRPGVHGLLDDRTTPCPEGMRNKGKPA